QCASRRSGFSHVIIHQQKFPELHVVVSPVRTNSSRLEAFRLGRHVRIKGCIFNIAAAGPKTHATYLVRIGLPGYRVGTGSFRGSPARKTTYSQVEASPEEVHRTALADKLRSELIEDRVR